MVDLLSLLTRYTPLDLADEEQAQQIAHFIKSDPQCFERTNLVGHITGSAWIVDPSESKVLLTHHKKLGKWLQVGGHADGESDVFAVALREAKEETGLSTFTPITTDIFDLDVHVIPARGNEPEHNHYDIRFAFRAEDTAFQVSEESLDLAWIEMGQLQTVTKEESMLRMARKWKMNHGKNIKMGRLAH